MEASKSLYKVPLCCRNVRKIRSNGTNWAPPKREMMIRGTRGVMRESLTTINLPTYLRRFPGLVDPSFFLDLSKNLPEIHLMNTSFT